MTAELAPSLVADPSTVSRPHPLDPLSADEVRKAATVLKDAREFGPSIRFVMISLAEPPKPPGLDFDLVPTPDRAALICLYDRAESMIYEAVVSLTTETLISWTPVPDRLPPIMFKDMVEVEELVR